MHGNILCAHAQWITQGEMVYSMRMWQGKQHNSKCYSHYSKLSTALYIMGMPCR